jgi:hypothetical protein
MQWFSILSGVISIASFIFALWVWMRSDMKINELRNVISSINDIAGVALWQSQMVYPETPEIRLAEAEKAIGFLSSIRNLASKYPSNSSHSPHPDSIIDLMERAIVCSGPKLWHRELSKTTIEVWVITPDLKPDSSDPITGELVSKRPFNSEVQRADFWR